MEPRRRVELWVMVVLLLIAAFLRFYRPESVPPGPSHDELRMMQLGELIVDGERPVHWKISYSAEPLYMYLLALAMPVWGFTPFGARLVNRWAGLLLVAVTHRLVRRLFGRRVALFSAAVVSVTWWPLFFSRVALRGITLPLTLSGAVFCLWLGLDVEERVAPEGAPEMRWGWLVGGAGLMGLTWYTFTGARSTIVILPLLLAHLGLLRFVRAYELWRVAAVTLGVAALIAAPIIYEMEVRPGTAETRLSQLSGVIDALLVGDPLPFLRQSARTVGVLGLTGDPNWRYNVSGRPPLGLFLGGLAVLGLLVSLWRWRQPHSSLLVIWTLLGLAPAMLTPEAPSFVRGIGALPALMVFPGIGVVALWDWVTARLGRRASLPVSVVLLLPLVVGGGRAFRDYFGTWPVQPEVHQIYQTTLTEALRDLSHSNLEGRVWASEPFPDDRHLLLTERILRRPTIDLRWFNADRALILPPVEGSRRYLIPGFAEPDPAVFGCWMDDARVLGEGRMPAGGLSYMLYEAEGGHELEQKLAGITAQSTASLDIAGRHRIPLPASFEETASLLGYEMADETVARGEDVHLIVYWRVGGPVYEPLASFVHLIDEQGHIVGQYDGFDVPPWEWESGLVFAQVYQFPISLETELGDHWLEIGLYHSHTMERLAILDETGSAVEDRLVLQRVSVE